MSNKISDRKSDQHSRRHPKSFLTDLEAKQARLLSSGLFEAKGEGWNKVRSGVTKPVNGQKRNTKTTKQIGKCVTNWIDEAKMQKNKSKETKNLQRHMTAKRREKRVKRNCKNKTKCQPEWNKSGYNRRNENLSDQMNAILFQHLVKKLVCKLKTNVPQLLATLCSKRGETKSRSNILCKKWPGQQCRAKW